MFRWRPRPLPLAALGLAVAILAGLAAFAVWRAGGQPRRFFDLLRSVDSGWETPPPSPALQRFFDRCAEVRPDLSEYDVDGLFADYPGGWSDDPDVLATLRGPVKRPPMRVKWFHSFPDAGEHSYAIHVYFDDSHRVVGKWVGGAE